MKNSLLVSPFFLFCFDPRYKCDTFSKPHVAKWQGDKYMSGRKDGESITLFTSHDTGHHCTRDVCAYPENFLPKTIKVFRIYKD